MVKARMSVSQLASCRPGGVFKAADRPVGAAPRMARISETAAPTETHRLMGSRGSWNVVAGRRGGRQRQA